jgi:hypothetical protein
MTADCCRTLRSLWHAFLILYIVISLGAVSSFAFRPSSFARPRRRRDACAKKPTHHQKSALQLGGRDNDDDTQQTLILPVFPLRKSVRVPSEALTLNLYEPRYLQLAEYVLKHEQQWFGAMYSSKKPQFIAKGDGPIVPMVEPGDVGVVCSVLFHEEAMVPVSRDDDDGPRHRRIKLKGLAIGRFRVEQVLHNGYGGGSICDGDSTVKPLPFILVEASRIDDLPTTTISKEDQVELEKRLFTTILEREEMTDQILFDIWGDLVLGDESSDGEEAAQAIRRFEVLLPSHLKKDSINKRASTSQKSRELKVIEKVLASWAFDSTISTEDQRSQIFSFAVSSAAANAQSVDGRLRLLQGRSTYDRLKYAYDEMQKSKSWQTIFSSFL